MSETKFAPVILVIIVALVILRILYSAAEILYEHDWPRHTWKGLIISLALLALCASAFGQSARIDIPLQTSGPNIPVTGGALPHLAGTQAESAEPPRQCTKTQGGSHEKEAR